MPLLTIPKTVEHSSKKTKDVNCIQSFKQLSLRMVSTAVPAHLQQNTIKFLYKTKSLKGTHRGAILSCFMKRSTFARTAAPVLIPSEREFTAAFLYAGSTMLKPRIISFQAKKKALYRFEFMELEEHLQLISPTVNAIDDNLLFRTFRKSYQKI